ncbi:MAG TPA: SpoIIE family protein phosphatase [Dongiaceae bacterium]|jgi:sigma-B regulation protein RsbU (phosphoserine phosphatase)|nr:SpoIIE family protein phosphatase [Dongiaceae bacterium]
MQPIETESANAGMPEPDELRLAAELSRSFASSDNVDATVRQALANVMQLLRVEAGSLFLRDDGDGDLICRASLGPNSIEGLRVPRGSGIVGRSVEEDRIEAVEDVSRDASFFKSADVTSGFVTRSILCAPMRVGKKPIGAVEVLNKQNGKPFDLKDRDMLQVMANAAALAIANARLADQLVEQERIKRELELASEIQRSLLPPADPDLPIQGINRPIREVSGDFYDFFTLPDGVIAFCLGDVSGKGINAALLMAKTSSLFRCLGKTIRAPARLLSILNREICETASRGMFVTMLAGLYDPASGELRFANAGHLPPMLRKAQRGYRSFEASAPPLGILRDASFPEETLRLDNEMFIVFSDGVTEYRYGADEELGLDGIDMLLKLSEEQPLADRLEQLLAELDRGGWKARDDLTLLAIDDSLASRIWRRAPAEAKLQAKSDFLFGLTIPAEADRLKLMRPALGAAGRAAGFSDDEIADLELAASEAVENIILHAYGEGHPGDITLAVHRLDDGLMLRIRDFAPKVDQAMIKPRPLDEVRPGGLGTHFIRAVMDDASFIPLPDGEGNLLELVKRRKKG